MTRTMTCDDRQVGGERGGVVMDGCPVSSVQLMYLNTSGVVVADYNIPSIIEI